MSRRLAAIAAAAAAACLLCAAPARAAKQVVALFPPENLAGPAEAGHVSLIAPALAEKLGDRFEVVTQKPDGAGDATSVKRRARAAGANYVVTGSLARIGKGLSLDLEIAPTEDPANGRIVVVSALESGAATDGGLPQAYRKMVVEAAAKLKYLFFGDDLVGEGAARRKIPRLAGTVARSRPVPGEVVSAAYGDADGDGKKEVVAAYQDSIAVFSVSGDDLVEKARIAGGGTGYIHVDAAGGGPKGAARIVATRYQDGKVSSELFEYDGKGYRSAAPVLPYFLRAASLGGEGTVLLGQEADPATVYGGPVFRVSAPAEGAAGAPERGRGLPLPAGTGLYDFVPVRAKAGVRYVVLEESGRLGLLDGEGRRVWESLESFPRSEISLESAIVASAAAGAAPRRETRRLAPRIFAADLDGDGDDEVVLLNNLSTSGWFFQGLLLRTNAEALCFAQDGDALRLAWRTPLVGGPAGDAFLVTTPAGKLDRMGVASRKAGRVLSGFGEWGVLWLR